MYEDCTSHDDLEEEWRENYKCLTSHEISENVWSKKSRHQDTSVLLPSLEDTIKKEDYLQLI